MFWVNGSNAFLGMFPQWTLAGAVLAVGKAARDWVVDQRPFHWAHGVCETEVTVRPVDETDTIPHRIVMRITPDTVRGWREIGINPFIEACAQLKEHLGGNRPTGELTLLTLL
jgi:hypothetical protein